MASRELIDYIKKQLDSGKDIVSLRSILLNANYTKEEIDDAINSIYQKKETKTLPIKWIILALSTLIILILLFFILLSPSKEQDLPIPSPTPEEEITPSFEETPSNTPEDIIVVTPSPTEIIIEETPFIDFTPEPINQDDITSPLNWPSFLDEIRDTTKETVNESISKCKTITDPSKQAFKDRCFEEISKSVGEPLECENIKDDEIKSHCYITVMVMIKRYDYCDRLTNNVWRKNCLTLRDKPFAFAEYTSS